MSKKNKGGNLKKMEQLLQGAEELINDEVKEIVETVDIEKEKEELTELTEKINEINQKKDEIIEEVREEVDKVITKAENMNKIILNREIKRAIKTNMGVSTKGVSGKQINGIINNYKQAVGEEMDKKQVDYIKTLNNSQAQSIIVTINAFKKYLRTQQATA